MTERTGEPVLTAATKGPLLTIAAAYPDESVIRQTDFDRWKAQFTADLIAAVTAAMDDFEGHAVLPYTTAQRSTVLNVIRAALQ